MSLKLVESSGDYMPIEHNGEFITSPMPDDFAKVAVKLSNGDDALAMFMKSHSERGDWAFFPVDEDLTPIGGEKLDVAAWRLLLSPMNP
ncbi:hypothetical protein ACQU0X_25900 [Pseudovibrio ascidiaceicola]|uniref:hypothetical protein n=1 Tax=Pseudovibrio ascidiaceicola TaxID=285279 RepID=UPI003D35BC30